MTDTMTDTHAAAVLARGWFHRRGPGDDYDVHDEASGAGKGCPGCVPCVIVRADAAPAEAQPVNNLPERDSSRPNTEQGLYGKFRVSRVDGSDQPGGKHHGCDYFVLDATHDPLAKPALAAYATAAEATHPQLAADMRSRYGLTPPPSAPVGVEVASLPALWRLREDNGEEHSEYDKGFETASDECARMLEDALAQQPAAIGEEIMVNAAHGVYTLPLQPSGLSSGPRFVVHVPAPEQPAVVGGACAAAAIRFALTDPEGMTFLLLWNEGEFDTLRREWPDAPSEVYVGADPLAAQQGRHPKLQETDDVQ